MFKKKSLMLLLVISMSLSMLLGVTANAATDYWYYWSDTGTITPSPINGPGGNFSVTWQNQSIFVGKGWLIGSPSRVCNYNVHLFNVVSGSALLTFYGWTRNQLVEYYIVENWVGYRPTGMYRGTVTSDGGTYDIYMTTRYNQPSIDGTSTFNQFWSVRQSKKPIGVNTQITFNNHVNAWRNCGMNLGSDWALQIFGVEASGSGSANVTVW